MLSALQGSNYIYRMLFEDVSKLRRCSKGGGVFDEGLELGGGVGGLGK